LRLGSKNEYNIKASLYSSDEILKSNPGQAQDGKISGFFNKLKNDSGDWRQRKWE
jgi:hypothetical protein